MDSGAVLDRATLFFGVYPAAFVADCVNAFNDYLCDAVDELEKSLRSLGRPASGAMALRSALSAFHAELARASDEAFATFEAKCSRDVFAIPAGVSLPDDAAFGAARADEAAEAALDSQLSELRRQVRVARFMNSAIVAEIGEVQASVAAAVELAESMKRLQRLCMNHNLSLASLPGAVAAGQEESIELAALMQELMQCRIDLEKLRTLPEQPRS